MFLNFAQGGPLEGVFTHTKHAVAGALKTCYRSLLNIETVWFDAEIPPSRADILHLRQRSSLPHGVRGQVFHTLVVNLAHDEDALWTALQKTVQYEVRRAERDGVRVFFEQQCDKATLGDFKNAYGSLSRRKSLSPLNQQQLHLLLAQDRLALSSSRSANGEVCSWHVYVLGNTRARLLHSVSHLPDQDNTAQRAFIGRANRLHHWKDIVHFRSTGYELYDFGGWYSGQKDQAKLRINAFKQGFGGTIEASYNAEIACSFRGRAALLLATWLQRGRNLSAAAPQT